MPQISPEDRIVRPFTPVPPGYIFVPKGNVYITKNCRKLTQAQDKPIYIVRSDKKKTLGIRVPRSVYNKALADNNATAMARAENVRRRDQNLEDKTEAELLSCFPRIPREHVPLILKHTLQKRSRRVGRSKEKPLNFVVELAVRAYVRHRLTDYDKLLRKGVDREKARKLVQGSIDEKVKQWSGPVEHAKTCKGNEKGGKKQRRDPKFQSRTSGSQIQKLEVGSGSNRYNSNPHTSTTAVIGKLKKGAAPTTSRSIERRSGNVTEKSLALRPGRTNIRAKYARETVSDEQTVIVISDDDEDFMDVDIIEIESDSLDDSDESYRDD